MKNRESHDAVLIGYPNQRGDTPMIVCHFIKSFDCTGETVVPFRTHGGSGLSGTGRTISDRCSGALVPDGLTVRGSTSPERPGARPKTAVTNWLEAGGFVD